MFLVFVKVSTNSQYFSDRLVGLFNEQTGFVAVIKCNQPAES
jgi:hypothetical protein